jgi:hypothetical protein
VSDGQGVKIRIAALWSAVIGGSAVVAMGALSLAANQEQTGGPAQVAGGMQTGQTVTQTVADTTSTTMVASPTLKAKFFGKS